MGRPSGGVKSTSPTPPPPPRRIRHHQRTGAARIMHFLCRVIIPKMPHNGQAQRRREIDLAHSDSNRRHGLWLSLTGAPFKGELLPAPLFSFKPPLSQRPHARACPEHSACCELVASVLSRRGEGDVPLGSPQVALG